MKNKKNPGNITVYVCPKCGWWQKWSGKCDSLCEAKTEPKVCKISE